MNNWKQLPKEILNQIFLSLESKKDIIQCISVCKNWKRTAQSIAFSDITIPYDGLFHLKRIEDVMRGYDSPGKYVNSINCYSLGWFQHHYLVCISNTFPSVVHINAPAPNSSFYKTIASLHKESKLAYLKSFSFCYDDNSSLEAYLNCAFEYRASLTKFGFSGDQWANQSLLFYFTGNLKKFPCLTDLYIICSKKEQQTIDLFDSVIDECTNLKHFDFKTQYIDAAITPTDIFTIQSRPDIERLDLEMNILNDDGILCYIKLKFLMLKQFTLINTAAAATPDFIDGIPKNKIIRLLMYISSIPVYSISCLHIEKDFDSLSRFWSLTANCERPKKLEICFDSHAKHYSIEIKASPCSLLFAKITYPVNELLFDNCSNVRNLIKNIGLHINQLTISKICEKSIRLDIIDDLLTPILNDCPNLNFLCLKNQTLRTIKDMSFPVNYALHCLQLFNCHIQGKFLSALSCSVSRLDILRLDNCKPIYATGEVIYGRYGVAINKYNISGKYHK